MTYSVNWCEASWEVMSGWHYDLLIGDVALPPTRHPFQRGSFWFGIDDLRQSFFPCLPVSLVLKKMEVSS